MEELIRRYRRVLVKGYEILKAKKEKGSEALTWREDGLWVFLTFDLGFVNSSSDIEIEYSGRLSELKDLYREAAEELYVVLKDKKEAKKRLSSEERRVYIYLTSELGIPLSINEREMPFLKDKEN